MSFEADYEYRTGIGTDIHRLVPDRKLMLAGVEVPYSRGLLGHSDGDVVIHAVIDALLGGTIWWHHDKYTTRWVCLESRSDIDAALGRREDRR